MELTKLCYLFSLYVVSVQLARMSQLSAAVLDPQPVSKEEGEGQNGEPEGSYCHMKNCDIYPPRKIVVGV